MTDMRREMHRKSDMMTRRDLLETFSRYKDEYRAAYPKTADSDRTLVSAYCNGLSAAHVAMDYHCAESTVHRALNRVRAFVRFQENHNRWQTLLDHIKEHTPDFGECDAHSILEMLYETYSDWNRLDDDAFREHIRNLNDRLRDLDIPKADDIMDFVYSACRTYQRTGFCEGIKLGVRLKDELNS